MLLSGGELAFALASVFASSVVAGLVGFGMGMMLSPYAFIGAGAAARSFGSE